jgi:hypothetical protein
MKRKIQIVTVLFMLLLVFSGLTAIPVKQEVDWLIRHVGNMDVRLLQFLYIVKEKLDATPNMVLYGFDWLAFAHIVIAVNFIGVLINPVKNKWVVQFGIIACVLVFPTAFTMGGIRGIPFFWQLIDCSFGVGGLFFLITIYRWILQLEKEENLEKLNIVF